MNNIFRGQRNATHLFRYIFELFDTRAHQPQLHRRIRRRALFESPDQHLVFREAAIIFPLQYSDQSVRRAVVGGCNHGLRVILRAILALFEIVVKRGGAAADKPVQTGNIFVFFH